MIICLACKKFYICNGEIDWFITRIEGGQPKCFEPIEDDEE